MSQPTKSSWLVDYSKHMGRVGALAVAVGIGSALTVPHVAWADDGTTGGSSSAGDSGGGTDSTPSGTSGGTTEKTTTGTGAAGPTGTATPQSPIADAEPKSATESEDPVGDPAEHRTMRHTRRDSKRATARLSTAKTAAVRDVPAPAAVKEPVKEPPTSDTPPDRPVAAPGITAGQVTVVSAATAVPTAVAPAQSAPAPGIRALVLGVLGVFGFSPNPVPGHTNNPLLEAMWAGYRRIESLFDQKGDHRSAVTAAVHTHLPTATTPDISGDPVVVDTGGQAPASLTASATDLPSVTATITAVNPAPSRPSSPLRTFVLNALGAFGFNPEPGHTNNPVLQAIWNGYRKLEAIFDNIAPDIDAVRVLGTRWTDDGYVAVDLAVDVSDYDGDPISTSTITGAAFTKNLDGTFTYLATPGYSGTDTVYIGATDSGNHYHQGTTIFDYTGNHTRVAAIAITVTAAPPLSAS
ncbi:Ig-like domain-containing protein [Mycolicibacterium cosmeticum]|uniref:Ig-like domain-containing protein n=1 Tax=Mycolicibacterium cosmeticum TaxID=258533 RepID=UPI0032046C50